MKQMQLGIMSTDNFIESVMKKGLTKQFCLVTILQTISDKITTFGEIRVKKSMQNIDN